MSSFTSELIRNYRMEFDRLREELRYYQKDEKLLWAKEGAVNNPPGNLVLHLVGNLNHYIGNHLGNTGYSRNREAEFSLSDVALRDLMALLDNAEEVVTATLKSLSEEDFDRLFPENVFGFEMSNRFMLMRLLAHLGYHIGQISYHRRILCSG